MRVVVTLLYFLTLALVCEAGMPGKSGLLSSRYGKRDTNKSNDPMLKSALQIRGGGGSLTDLDWRYFLAGGICAAWSHGITTPIGTC
ncbi:hypothetical protein EON65_22730 [archaeon]|nr:MAG: hypothetical protein EON65_22730 [archaeon]